MNYKCFVNGVELKTSETLELFVEEEKIELLSGKSEGSISFYIKPNPLWKRQQETGIPRRVHLSYLCNL